jgi:glycosyltransferase involved in cell wall biosynthesis
MKIALVSSSSGSHGGGEFYLRELAGSLQLLGHRVTTWISDHSQMDPLAKSFETRHLSVGRFDYPNTYHRRLRSAGAYFDGALHRRLSVLFRESGADILHINQQCLEDALDLVAAASMCGISAVSTIHVTRSATSLNAKLGQARDFLARRALRKSRLPLIGISKTSALDLSQFVNGHRTLTVPDTCNRDVQSAPFCPVFAVANGVATPTDKDRDSLRASLGLQPQHVVLGVVARIEHQKNPLFMCQLLKALPTFVHCVWVGDGRMRTAMENERDRLGLQERLHLPGWQDQASKWMAAFDVFTLGSFYEGLPLALLEAMAAKLPCVASRVDGTQDAIDDGTSGYLCPVNAVDVWVRTLEPLIASADLRVQIGAAARQRYEADFSIEAMAKRTIAVYEDVIRRG